MRLSASFYLLFLLQILLLTLTLQGQSFERGNMNKINPPIAKKQPYEQIIHGEKLVVKPCVLKIDDFEADVKGVSFLNGSIDYFLKVSLLPFEKIKLPFHVTGTYSKPIITLGKGKKM